MKKLVAMAALLMLFPAASAGFISSSISIDVTDPPAVPLDKSVTTMANVTFSWGFGNIFPLPITVNIQAKDVPDWLYVSISPSKFTITPTGFFGGKSSKNVQIIFKANKEVTAFVGYPVKIHAYTNGSFILRGSEATAEVYVMEDFVDNGLTIERPSAVNLYTGEEKTIYFNITNKCNAPVYIEIEEENTTGFSLSYEKKFSIPSKAKKAVPVKIKAEESKEAEVRIKFNYYPAGHEEKRNYEEVYLTLASRTKPGGSALAVGLVIIIIALIAFIIWKKKR
ncbi:MAG: hypothetical protein DRN29_00595 [Thermoplasmata archaeon]|nr:MAG: hypothetical protein DRN29_00595 [Thermoplasmata archaeon]